MFHLCGWYDTYYVHISRNYKRHNKSILWKNQEDEQTEEKELRKYIKLI